MAKSVTLFVRFLQWLFFSLFVGYGFGWMAGGQELALAGRLRTKGIKVPGSVTSVKSGDALNSAGVNYTFDLGGKTIYGYSHVQAPKVPRLSPGSPIEVMYLAADPKESGVDLEGMSESGWRALRIAAVLELVVAAIIWLPLCFRRNRPFDNSDVAASLFRVRQKDIPPGNYAAGVVVSGIMLLAGTSMLFLGAIPNYQKANALAQSSQTASAQITAVYDHSEGKGRYVLYSFAVNGQNYNGQADYNTNYSNRGKIAIHYLPSDPSYSAINPQDKSKNSAFGIIFMIVWNLIVGAVFVFTLLKLRSSGTSS